MIRSKADAAEDVIRWMESEAAELWPAILGSLSFRRSPCIHATCPGCLAGEQDQSHVLYGRHNGRRFAVYVPEDLVGEVRRAVDNGRALQDLLVRDSFDWGEDDYAVVDETQVVDERQIGRIYKERVPTGVK